MGGIATPALALAVANAGGLGTVSLVGASPEVVTAALDALVAETSGSVGMNVLMPFVDVDAVSAAASRVRVVDFFYGEPDSGLVDRVHAGGALACWQVGSAREASAAAHAGCDIVVAQGAEAGGHVRGQVSLLPLLDSVLEAVDVPVVAAGGISTGRGMAAALAAGASAVRVGTRFVATHEANAHPAYVDALVAATASDTVLTTAFDLGWPDAPHRVLRSCLDAVHGHPDAVVGQALVGDRRVPLRRFSPSPPDRETTGSIEAMALYAGESVGAVTEVLGAAEVIRELSEEAERLLGLFS